MHRVGIWVLGVLGSLLAAGATAAPLVVIVAPKHAEVRFDRAELALIYERKHLYWPGGGRIQPVNLPAQHPLRLAFSQAVLGTEPAALERYWNEQYFHGVLPPYVLASGEAMLRFVAETPSAIGYLDACELGAGVAVIAWLDHDGRLHTTRTAPDCQPEATAP